MDYKKLVDKRTHFTKMSPLVKMKGALNVLEAALLELEEENKTLIESNQELQAELYKEILNSKE